MIFEPNTDRVDSAEETTYCPTCNRETTRVTTGVGPHYGECGSGHVYLLTEAKHKRDEPNEYTEQGAPEKAPKTGAFIIAAFEGEESGTCVVEVVRWGLTADRAEIERVTDMPETVDAYQGWLTASGRCYTAEMIGWWPCPIVRMSKNG